LTVEAKSARHSLPVFQTTGRRRATRARLYREEYPSEWTALDEVPECLGGSFKWKCLGTDRCASLCEILRKTSDWATTAKAKPGRSSETCRTRNARAVRAPKPLDAPVITQPGYW